MARQAEAERERRAKVIAAEGEFQASERLAQAAAIMAREPMTLQLRYLQTCRSPPGTTRLPSSRSRSTSCGRCRRDEAGNRKRGDVRLEDLDYGSARPDRAGAGARAHGGAPARAGRQPGALRRPWRRGRGCLAGRPAGAERCASPARVRGAGRAAGGSSCCCCGRDDGEWEARARQPAGRGGIHLPGAIETPDRGAGRGRWRLALDVGGPVGVAGAGRRVPLPPYICRPAADCRRSRALPDDVRARAGAVAAPTRRLHPALRRGRRRRNLAVTPTLHVGPARSCRCAAATSRRIGWRRNATAARGHRGADRGGAREGGRVVAVGTDHGAGRESAAGDGRLRADPARRRCSSTPATGSRSSTRSSPISICRARRCWHWSPRSRGPSSCATPTRRRCASATASTATATPC